MSCNIRVKCGYSKVRGTMVCKERKTKTGKNMQTLLISSRTQLELLVLHETRHPPLKGRDNNLGWPSSNSLHSGFPPSTQMCNNIPGHHRQTSATLHSRSYVPRKASPTSNRVSHHHFPRYLHSSTHSQSSLKYLPHCKHEKRCRTLPTRLSKL